MEIPLREDASAELSLRTREQWRFRKRHRFTHRVSARISLNGRFTLYQAPLRLTIDELRASSFILRRHQIMSTIPGQKRADDFFLGAFDEEMLILHYLGPKLPRGPLKRQGGCFERRR